MGRKDNFSCATPEFWSKAIACSQITLCGAALILYTFDIFYNVVDVGQLELDIYKFPGSGQDSSALTPTSLQDETQINNGAAMVILILLVLRYAAGLVLGLSLLRFVQQMNVNKLRCWLLYQFIIFVLGLMLLFMQAALHYHRHEEPRPQMTSSDWIKTVFSTVPTILNVVALWVVSGLQRDLEERSYLVPLIPRPKYAGIPINDESIMYL